MGHPGLLLWLDSPFPLEIYLVDAYVVLMNFTLSFTS